MLNVLDHTDYYYRNSLHIPHQPQLLFSLLLHNIKQHLLYAVYQFEYLLREYYLNQFLFHYEM